MTGKDCGLIIFCKHKNLKFIRNIHGDEINYISPIKMIYRSEWKCKDCGKIIYKGELYHEG